MEARGLARLAVAGKAALVVSLGIAAGGILASELRRPEPPMIDTVYASGTHLLLVLVAPTGEVSARDVAAAEEARVALRALADARGYHFGTVGVAFDWDVRDGLAKLEDLGPFDELIVGRNWLNTGIAFYVRAKAGRLALPQFIVLSQQVDVAVLPAKVEAPHRVFSAVGYGEIDAWARAGYPVPVQ